MLLPFDPMTEGILDSHGLDHYQSLKAAWLSLLFVDTILPGDETYDLLQKTEKAIQKIISSLLHNSTLSVRPREERLYS